MGGADKAVLLVGGVALLDRVLAAARPVCDRLVVVGPPRASGVAGAEFVQEAVPGGGPVPAVLAGLDHAGCDVAVVVAGDLPFLVAADLRALVDALPASAAGAVAAVDDRGRPHPLLAAHRAGPLRDRAEALGAGAAAARLLPDGVGAVDLGPAATVNVNSPADLQAADLLAGHGRHVVDTAQWLRRLVAAAAPDLTEAVYGGWHGFGYRHPVAGHVCAVFPGVDGVRLSFERGAALADPHRLLRGGGRQVRYVEVGGPGAVPAARLVELVGAALELGGA
jgi:molybdopterin-guanine dinucleotide biosynthesis protein A